MCYVGIVPAGAAGRDNNAAMPQKDTMSKTQTQPMTSDAVSTTEMALKIMLNPKTNEADRARCADIIRGVVANADDGLRQAAEILKRVAMNQTDVTDAKAATEWLGGGR
jgi:hypothetical protein